jgi:hypothetical protein
MNEVRSAKHCTDSSSLSSILIKTAKLYSYNTVNFKLSYLNHNLSRLILDGLQNHGSQQQI